MSEHFAEPKSAGGRVKVELNLSNCSTKTDLKNATGADTTKLSKQVDLASLKSNVDKNSLTNLTNFKSKIDKLDVDK